MATTRHTKKAFQDRPLKGPAWRRAGRGTGGWAVALAGLVLASAQAAPSGLPACAGAQAPEVLLSGQGPLESLAFDRQGRLLYTDITAGALRRLDHPGGSPVTVASGVSSPGGIAVASDQVAYVGTGNTLTGLFPKLGKAGIARVDLDTGTLTPEASGLAMANGMVRADDGTFYASDDLAASLDRVLPDGTVQPGWLPLNSNGLALSPDQRTLYVNQMIPAKVWAVDRATGQQTLVMAAPPARKWSWLDGLGADDAGRLYVAVYWAGEVWRLTPADGQACVLAEGLFLPSAVVVGRSGQGFSPTSAYITTHSGRIHEVKDAVPPGTD